MQIKTVSFAACPRIGSVPPVKKDDYEGLTSRFEEGLGGERKGKKDEDALNCGKEIYRGSEA